MIEKDIFKKSSIAYDKLEAFGFKKDGNKYLISKYILNDTFRIDVKIEDNNIIGQIYDLEFNEEYINYRLDNQTGTFVSKIRKEFINFLNDIKINCTYNTYFISSQANRIAHAIFNKYHDNPTFLWDKYPGYGVFRNPKNNKWYGLVININRNKLDEIDEEIEVINIKIDNLLINELLKKKGFYKAYHMNKNNWVTIILNDTVSDKEILNYIEVSHKYTEKEEEWIIPANPKYYDVINCFNDIDTIMWKQVGKIYVGDIAYLYVGSPYSCLLYKCKVIETDIPYTYKDKNLKIAKAMKLKLLHRYNYDEYPLDVLKKYGIKAIRSQRTITKELSDKLNCSIMNKKG